MNLKILKNTFQTVYLNIIRQPVLSLATVLALSVVVVLLQTALFFKSISTTSLELINQKVDLVLEVKEGKEYYHLEDLIKEIKIVQDVEVEFIDKNKALDSFLQDHLNIKEFLQKYRIENPLFSSLQIYVKEADKMQEVLRVVKQSKYSTLIQQPKIDADFDQQKRVEKLAALASFVNTSMNIVLIVFILIVILIIFNVIYNLMSSKKEEIELMHLIGAEKSYIQAPFLLEGLSLSLISLCVATVFNIFLYLYFSKIVDFIFTKNTIADSLSIILSNFSLWQAFLIEIVILVTSAIIATGIALHVYLKRS